MVFSASWRRLGGVYRASLISSGEAPNRLPEGGDRGNISQALAKTFVFDAAHLWCAGPLGDGCWSVIVTAAAYKGRYRRASTDVFLQEKTSKN